MARLNEQQLLKQGGAASSVEDDTSSITTDPYANTPPAGSSTTPDSQDAAEIERLKRQLELANERMAQMALEVTQSQIARHTVEQAIGSPFPAAQDVAYNGFNGSQPTFNAPISRRTSPFQSRAHTPPFGLNGLLQAGQLQAANYYHGQKSVPV